MRSNLDNYLLDLLNDFPDSVSGDVEAPSGYFVSVTVPANEVPDEFRDDLIGDNGHANLVIAQDNYGFIRYRAHYTTDEMAYTFSALEEDYLSWLDEDEV